MDSFIGWIGGKKLLRNEICNRFPAEIDSYVEVFGGAGWVLFNKDRHAAKEVYNDINGNLVNLFRCVKYHPEAIETEMEYLINAREIFQQFEKQDYSYMTDIQRATRFLYLVKMSYGCKTRTYGANARKCCNIKKLLEVKERLQTVVVENLSYEALIKRYDKQGTLFYCDPPYYQTEQYYDIGDFVFNEEQHIKLRDILCNINGKFILSYNDCDFVKALYQKFNIVEKERQNNLASVHGREKIYKELIINNF